MPVDTLTGGFKYSCKFGMGIGIGTNWVVEPENRR